MRERQTGTEAGDESDEGGDERIESPSRWWRKPIDGGQILFAVAAIFFSLYLVVSQALYYQDRQERNEKISELQAQLAAGDEISACRAKFAADVAKKDVDHQLVIGEVASTRLQGAGNDVLLEITNKLIVAGENLKSAVEGREAWERVLSLPCPL